MDLQEKLIELSEYGVSFNVANDNFVIKIKYNDNWTIIQPDGDDIAFYRDENVNSVYYYVAPITTSIDKIFAAIDETIDYNLELELKVKLFREKMTELQELFTKENLEVLKTLEFKVKKKKDKIKKSKQTEIEEEVEEQTETKNEVESTTVEETKETEKEEKPSEIDDKISKILNNK